MKLYIKVFTVRKLDFEIEDYLANLNEESLILEYGPCNIRDLTPGQTKLWCACGLSQKQPWCDGSHKGTGFLPIKWTVPEKFQTQYELCACKHTASPPLCDGSHIKVPLEVLKRQRQCANVHSDSQNLCTGCGWRPDW
eukprot:gene10620-19360_t